MNENSLAFYMGYAFSHAVHVQHLLGAQELMVPYVVYWEGEQPTPVPYPASTQQEAVDNARAAREQAPGVNGWSSGREGLFTQADGSKRDLLLIEGWVPGLAQPLELITYYYKEPFRLVKAFLWKQHAQVRRTPESGREFMTGFQRGILSQPFGPKSLECYERGLPFATA